MILVWSFGLDVEAPGLLEDPESVGTPAVRELDKCSEVPLENPSIVVMSSVRKLNLLGWEVLLIVDELEVSGIELPSGLRVTTCEVEAELKVPEGSGEPVVVLEIKVVIEGEGTVLVGRAEIKLDVIVSGSPSERVVAAVP